jgi:acyl-CoA thioester hydrolase
MTDDAPHIWPIRVYFEDTDAGGVVYHVNYLKFAERARTELMRAAGCEHTELAKDYGVLIVVRHCAIEYIAPARLDDALEVRSHVTTVKGASLTIRQEIFLNMPETGGDSSNAAKLLVTLDLRLACVSTDLRPARLPPKLKQVLSHTNAAFGHIKAPGSHIKAIER